MAAAISKFVTSTFVIDKINFSKIIKISALTVIYQFSFGLLAQNADPRAKRIIHQETVNGTTHIQYVDGTSRTMPLELLISSNEQADERIGHFIDEPTDENFQKLSDLQKLDLLKEALVSYHLEKKPNPSFEFLVTYVQSSSSYLSQLASTLALKDIASEASLLKSEGQSVENFDGTLLKLFKVAGQQNPKSQASVLCEIADGLNYTINDGYIRTTYPDLFTRIAKSDLELVKFLLRNSVSGVNPQNIFCTTKEFSQSKNNFLLSDVMAMAEAAFSKEQNPKIHQPASLTAGEVRKPSQCDIKQISHALFGSFEMAKTGAPEVKHLVGTTEPNCYIHGLFTKDRSGKIKFLMRHQAGLNQTIEFSVSHSTEGFKNLISQILKTQAPPAPPIFSTPSSGLGGAIYSPFAAH